MDIHIAEHLARLLFYIPKSCITSAILKMLAGWESGVY